MCTPAAQVAMMAASMVMQGQQQKRQARYQAGTNDYNARVLENDATKARNAGTERENDHRKAVVQLMAQQKAALGASGIVTNTGSAGQLLQDTANIGEIDALRIRSNVDNQFATLTEQSSLTDSKADAFRSAGNSAFNTSLLKGAGSVFASKWYTDKSSSTYP